MTVPHGVPPHTGGPRPTNALTDPRNRTLLFVVAGLVLALLIGLAIYQGSDTRSAQRGLASANEAVAEKQQEVEEARRLLEQKTAELRVARAEADANAARLNGAVDAQVSRSLDDPAVTGAGTRVEMSGGDLDTDGVYYVRTRDGRYLRVDRP